jgi:hypothetical protein
MTPPALHLKQHPSALSLCHTKAVFMAEVEATREGLLLYLKIRILNNISRPKALYILSDCQSAIQALSAITLNSRTVEKCRHLLNATAALTPTYLNWTKAHVGQPVHEKAGAAMEHLLHSVSTRDIASQSFIKTILKSWLMDLWAHWWIISNPCRQTKI